jgi:hypothetical protein
MFYFYDENGLIVGDMVTFPTETEPLFLEKKDEYTYPVHGWYYFATESEAKEFFGIVDEVIDIDTETGNII